MKIQILPVDNIFVLAAFHYDRYGDYEAVVLEKYDTQSDAEIAEKYHRFYHWIQPEWSCPDWLPKHYPYRGSKLLEKSLYDSYEGLMRPFSNPTHRMSFCISDTQCGIDEAYEELDLVTVYDMGGGNPQLFFVNSEAFLAYCEVFLAHCEAEYWKDSEFF